MAKPGIIQRIGEYFYNSEYRGKLNVPSIPLTEVEFFGGEKTDSGEVVNKDTILKLSAIYRANRILNDTIASLPLNVYEKQSNGRAVAIDHDANYLIHSEPNPLQSSFTWRETSQGHFNMNGNAVSKIHGANEAIEILDPEKIKLKKDGFKLTYEVYHDLGNGKVEVERLDYREIIHIANFSYGGFWGKGFLDVAKEASGAGLAQQSYSSRFFANDSTPNVVLIAKGNLSSEQKENSKASWQKAQAGKNRGKAAVMMGDWDIKTFSVTPEQAQFLQTRNFTVTEIARFFGVEPHLLYNLERSTFNNIEEQGLSFVTYTIRGIAKRWEQELNRKLFTEGEKRSGKYYTKFNLEGLMRADAKSRAEYYRTLFNLGALNSNEIRDLENRNSDPSLERYWIQQNMMPMDKADEILKNKKKSNVEK